MHVSHSEALSVNGRKVILSQLFKLARFENSMPVVQSYIERLLMVQWAEQLRVTVSEEELEEALAGYREHNGLCSEVRLQQWLQANRLTLGDVTEFLRMDLLREKLVDPVVSEEEIQRYFHENILDYDQAVISITEAEAHGQGEEIDFRLEGETDLQSMSVEFSVDLDIKREGGFVGAVRRADLEPDVVTAVFDAKPGDVIGPIETMRGYRLIRLADIRRAELDEGTRHQIRQDLFLEKLRAFQGSSQIRTSLWEIMDADEGAGRDEPRTGAD